MSCSAKDFGKEEAMLSEFFEEFTCFQVIRAKPLITEADENVLFERSEFTFSVKGRE